MKPLSMSENDKLIRQKEYMKKAGQALREVYPDVWPPLAYVHSYGCQQNVSDGEKLKGMLAEIGYGFTDSPDNADLVLFNTCAVREHAEDRVYGNIGALKHVKARRPGMLIGLCGCMMQQDHVVERIKKSFPHVDMIFGTHSINRFPENMYHALTDKKRIIDNVMDNDPYQENLPVKRDGTVKAWVPVMYGCDNFCSYCIVPYVRGRERSRSSEAILEEVRGLVQAGYKEITLLGQNVNSYGKGLDEDVNFARLLRQINDIPGDFWVRFMTSHPKDASRELIDTIAACDKVCKQLHLPVQSGSNRILKEMNRRYTVEQYKELVRYAKEIIPGIGLSTDIIVGFPGETREDFLQTLELIKEIRYDMIFSFIYSPRKGTVAAEKEDPIPKEEKSAWFRELLQVQETISEENHQKKIGTVCRVLLDSPGKSEDGMLQGRSTDNTIVEVKTSADMVGSFVDITIENARNWSVSGSLVTERNY